MRPRLFRLSTLRSVCEGKTNLWRALPRFAHAQLRVLIPAPLFAAQSATAEGTLPSSTPWLDARFVPFALLARAPSVSTLSAPSEISSLPRLTLGNPFARPVAARLSRQEVVNSRHSKAIRSGAWSRGGRVALAGDDNKITISDAQGRLVAQRGGARRSAAADRPFTHAHDAAPL